MNRSLEIDYREPVPPAVYAVSASASPAMIATPQRTEEPPLATGAATSSSLPQVLSHFRQIPPRRNHSTGELSSLASYAGSAGAPPKIELSIT
jgi:hypothetical protein